MEDNVVGQVKKCPYCSEDIPAEAAQCPHCNSVLDGSTQTAEPQYQVQYQPETASVGNGGTGMAIASFVLGILGLICCCIGSLGSVLAIVFGFVAKSQIKRSGDTHMSWMATTGIILGFVGIAFAILGMLFWFVAMVFQGNNMGNFHFNFPD
jgi:hypothetical protein